MKQKAHKRPPAVGRAVAATTALLLGEGGLVGADVYAGAGTSERDGASRQQAGGQARGGSAIGCPEVVNELSAVPDRARGEVDRSLALLDTRVAEAYQRLAGNRERAASDPGFARDAVLGPLEDRRRATIERIAIAIGRVAGRPTGLEGLAPCAVRDGGPGRERNDGQDQDGGGGPDRGASREAHRRPSGVGDA